jgi:Baseplate J-like protein
VPSYLSPPIETDPQILAQDCFDFLQTEYPGWIPAEGNFEVWLIEAMARMIGQLRDITSLVPTAIFKYFGKTLMGILPIEPSNASGTSTWTMIDDLGYTIPAGTQLQIRDSAGNYFPFQTNVDVVVAPGSTVTDTGGVSITAVFEGEASSGLSGDGELLDILPFIDSVAIEGETTGGQDGQTDEEYLNHLVEQLQLMAPRPILAPDFAGMAKNIAGVWRAVAIDGLVPSVNEVQRVAVDATGGTFTLTFGGQTTSALAFNVTAAALQSALAALSSIGPNNVAVTGGPGSAGAATPYLVTFQGSMAGSNVAQMTSNGTLLTGGAHTCTVTTVTAGAATQYNIERYVTVFPVDEFGQPVAGNVRTTLAGYLDSLREVNFVVPVVDPQYQMFDVQTTIVALPGTDKVALQAAVVGSLQAYLDPSKWGVPASDTQEWMNDTHLRYLEVAQVINNVLGVNYIVSLTTAIHNASPNVVDITMPGDVALPTAGSIVVTVN